MSSQQQRGWLRSSWIALVAVWVVVGPVTAAGTGPFDAMERLQPRFDRTNYQALVERLELGSGERSIANVIYENYAADLADLAARADRARIDAGADRVDDALTGRVFVAPDELRRLRLAVLDADAAAAEEAGTLFERLIADLEHILPNSALLAEALAPCRRIAVLHPRRVGMLDDGYAGDGLDLIELVAEASAEDGELAALDPAVLASILVAYERRLDRLLIAQRGPWQSAGREMARARIERDPDARAAAERVQISLWAPLYELNASTAAAIEQEVVGRLGAPASAAWRNRFEAAVFPRLYAPGRGEREHVWILRRAPDVAAEADAALAEYGPQLTALRREAAALMLRGRAELGAMVHDRMDMGSISSDPIRELYRELLRNSGERATRDEALSGRLRGLLTERQRKQMRSDLAAAAYGRRR